MSHDTTSSHTTAITVPHLIILPLLLYHISHSCVSFCCRCSIMMIMSCMYSSMALVHSVDIKQMTSDLQLL